MEIPCRRPAQDIDVGKHGHAQVLQRQIAEELVLLAGVVADLLDDEGGPGLDLFCQLEILGHDLVLEALEIVDHRAGKETRDKFSRF